MPSLMPPDRFADCCSAVMDLLDIDARQTHAGGPEGISFVMPGRGVRIDLQAGPEPQRGAFLGTRVWFGIPAPAGELDALRGLLDANGLLGGEGEPTFVREPTPAACTCARPTPPPSHRKRWPPTCWRPRMRR